MKLAVRAFALAIVLVGAVAANSFPRAPPSSAIRRQPCPAQFLVVPTGALATRTVTLQSLYHKCAKR